MRCYDCPRKCGADRDGGAFGYCGGGRHARIAKVIEDFKYEEPCLGDAVTAVFFGGCALKCTYCQNYKISRGGAGKEYSDAELAELLSGSKAPLDLVTPSHYLSAIERAVDICGSLSGIVYNSSGYETVDAVRRAGMFTDVFLADFKYADDGLAERFSRAPDYTSIAVAALEKMRDTADVWTEENGRSVLKRGLVVRHLVLPEQTQNSIAVLDAVAKYLGTDTVISIMSQFTPNGVGEPSARLKRLEYKLVVEHARRLGFKNGYIQRFDSADQRFTPDF